MDFNQHSYFYCIQKKYINSERDHLSIKGLKKRHSKQIEANSKQVGVAILISDKIVFKLYQTKKIGKDTTYLSKKDPPRKYRNSKHLCTKHKYNLVHKINPTAAKITI